MIHAHPYLTTPKENAPLWRYLDFTKFVSMLDSNGLWFTRSDKLPDKYEGMYTHANVEAERRFLASILKTTALPKQMRTMQQVQTLIKKQLYVNCWYVHKHQSAAMWKTFLKSNEGVAIRTSYKRLKQSVSSFRFDLFPTMIAYLDYAREKMDTKNVLIPFANKRKSFEYEREMRLIYASRFVSQEEGAEARQCRKTGKPFKEWKRPHGKRAAGFNVPTEIDVLIERVYVAPTTELWFQSLVESVLLKYGLNKEVIRSDIDGDPLF